jgi:hypothetical protein
MAYFNVPDLTIDALKLYIHVFSLRKDTAAIFLFGLFVKHFQLLGRPILLSTKLSNASLDRAEHRKTFDFQITHLIKDYKSVLHLSPYWPNLLRSKASVISMSKSPTIMRKRVDQPLCNTTWYPKWRRRFVWLYDDIRCAIATATGHNRSIQRMLPPKPCRFRMTLVPWNCHPSIASLAPFEIATHSKRLHRNRRVE